MREDIYCMGEVFFSHENRFNLIGLFEKFKNQENRPSKYELRNYLPIYLILRNRSRYYDRYYNL